MQGLAKLTDHWKRCSEKPMRERSGKGKERSGNVQMANGCGNKVTVAAGVVLLTHGQEIVSIFSSL